MLKKSTIVQFRKALSSFLLLTLPFLMVAQTNSGAMWSHIDESEVPDVGRREIIPSKYQTLKLDVDQMKAALAKAPMTKTKAVTENPAYLDIPWPDGTLKTFQIIESPIMEKGLQDIYPTIKTYVGFDITDATKYMRMDLTPQGFHGMILTAGEGTVFIDPYTFGGGDIEHYISYFKHDFSPLDGEEIICAVTGGGNPLDNNANSSSNPSIMFGNCDLRTYRLALAATAEYTAFHGGVAAAAAAQVTTMNRVNGVYERDFAIRMVIVAGNNALIYTNAGSDPYTNSNGSTMLNENQANVDAVIGSANYDIGHVFSTGGGGIAQLRSPCGSGKARGVTGSGSPVNDPFDIDYVAHEMGHQFGGNHTQYNTCNRNNGTAMEPGSASTIMGYAGICPPNVQSNSDDHFHGITLQEVGAFITNGSTGGSCPVITALSNTAPSVTGTNAAGVTIPGSTPFMLTATATDPDANTLTYCWEQMDNTGNETMPPASTNNQGPAFRSMSPSTSPTRYFPNLPAIIAGTTPTWEVLASVNRTMDFRVSVRDNAAGGGCTDNQDITLTVDGGSGPFVVNYPSATGITWNGFTSETVTWSVNGTDVAPVACATVDILLSTDGGLTYPTVLASGVPNDGSQSVTVPNVGTTTARVMVVCANGTFFDISNNNFTIVVASCNLTATSTNVSCNGGNDGTATASATGSAPFSFLWSNGQTNAVATALTAGTYSVTLTDNLACTSTASVTLTQPSALTSSINSTSETCTGNDGTATVSGSGGTGAITYLWSNGQTNTTATALAAAAYTVTITDANGCTITDNITVLNSCCGLSATGAGSMLTCAGDNNGTATATPTGTPGYTYLWSGGGQTNQTATGLSAGVYTVTVTDASPCTATTTATVTEPSAISSAPTATPESCALNDGAGSINASGGTGALTFLWDATAGAQTNNTATGLIAGNYSYTVTDASGCTFAGIMNVPTSCIVNTCDTISNINFATDTIRFYTSAAGPPTQYVAGHNQYGDIGKYDFYNYGGTNTHIQGTYMAFGVAAASNGTNTFNVVVRDGTGGTPGAILGSTPVRYQEVLDSLNAGNALLYIPFNNIVMPASNQFFVGIEFTYGADTIALFSNTIGETTPNTAWEQWGDLSFHPYSDPTGWNFDLAHYIIPVLGTLPTASFTQSSPTVCSGGTITYTNTSTNGQTYQWTFPGGTPSSATGNSPVITYNTAGTYDVTLIATNDCMADTVVMTNTITVADLTTSTSSTPETCTGNDGSATATASGGIAPYTYLWSNGQTNAAATALATATYGYTITSSNGCVTTGTVNVADACVPCTMTAATTSTNVNCNGGADGTATAVPASGTPTYTYLWSTGGQTNQTATGLVAGIYTVTVTDAAACTATASATITEPSTALSSAPSATTETCTGNDGSATANGTGGTGALTYLWSPSGQTNNTATGLSTGNYTYTITDANGCTDIGLINVPTSCLNGCDTVSNINFATDTIRFYTSAAGPPTQYVAGHNQYGDLGKYDYFNYGGANTHIQGTYMAFGVAAAGNATNTFNVVVRDGTGGTPGAILGTVPTRYQEVLDSLNAGNALLYIPFNNILIPASNQFFVGIEFTYGADTIALLSNTIGETTPNTAWEQWGDLSFHPYSDAGGWNFDLAHYIVPVLGTDPTAGFTQSSPTVCEGNTITFTNTSTLAVDYQWSFPGGTPATSTAVNPVIAYNTAGTYDVTLIAINDCMADTIVMTNAVTVNALGATATGTNISCNGGNDGTATGTPVGGAATYTYLWSFGGQTNAMATGLSAGSYTVTISDGNGCSASASVTLTEPSLLSATANVTSNYNGADVSCNGSTDGSATATATGGTGAMTYLWSNGQTNATATALGANAYTVTVTDANGCSVTANTTLTNPVVVGASNTTTAETCAGNDGTATAVATGGTGTMTYLWSDAQVTATAVGLTAGTYTVTVTDANGCTASTTANVANGCVCSMTASAVTNNDVSCNGGTDGQATVTQTGGTPTISYLWSNGQTNATAIGLGANIYSVTVTDNNSCTATATATITEPSLLSATASVTSNYNGADVSCNGSTDGSATATATGGTGAMTYLWSNGQTNATATALGANAYTVTVTDANGCSVTANTTLTNPVVVGASNTTTAETCAGNDGTATAVATGGTGAMTYLWSDAQVTATAVGLTAGTYTVTVTDANGCTASTTANVANGCVCSMTASAVTDNDVSCNGGTDGQATVTQTGGTPTISYLWSNGQTNATATGLGANIYSVTVTDNNSCTATATATITEPSLLSATANVTSNYNGADVSCNGSTDGSATATATGGTGAMTYLWSNGQTNATATALGANAYTVTVTDANGCSVTANATLTEPTLVGGAMSMVAETCAGNDGTATAMGTGGTGSYTYLWDASTGSQATATAVGLTAGLYNVTITDVNGCTATNSINVNDGCLCPMTASAVTNNNVSCNGGTDGQATVTQTGGTPVISYLWSNGQTNATAIGLAANVYTVTVTDNGGCTATASATITEPSLLSVTANVTSNYSGADISCNGASDGQATATTTGGTGVITYLWSNGQGNAVATALGATTYTVTATDANGCSATANVNLTEPTVVTGTVTVGSPILCNGDATGSCIATPTPGGGTAPYTYLWDASTGNQTTPTATGLSAGMACVTITDANGCQATICGTLTEPSAVSVTAVTDNNVSCNGGTDGQATATGAGGTGSITYMWSNGQTNATATALAANVYSVTATDANGCQVVTSATITQPSAVGASATTTDESCANNDGTATGVGTGGTGAISYLWSNGQMNTTATGLTAGAYGLTVTDANGCSATTTANVADGCICLMTATAVTNNNVSCNGGSDGQATVVQTGGTPAITYLWSNGQTNATAIGLAANVYTVTVTDNSGCTATASATITEPSIVSVSPTVDNNVNCNGGNDGQATASATGGNGGFTFVWSNGQSAATATGLTAGTYTVTGTDINGCFASASVTITQPISALSSLVTGVQNPSCNGNSNGSITVNAFGGSPAYTFDIGTGSQTTGTFTGLSSGSYTITVTDANGCTSTAATGLANPALVTANASVGTAVSCAGNADGTANASAFGGNGGFTFVWSNGQSAATATGLSAGAYSVTATDVNGCFGTASVTLTAPSGVTATASAGSPISCAGGNDGTAMATGAGGTGAYNFVWTNGQTTATATGLAAGTHFVTVSDANGCSDVSSVILTDPAGMSTAAFVTSNFNGADVSCNGASDGSATANVTGGSPAYSYLWSPSGQTNATATGLSAGPYTIVITDASGCTAVTNVTLTEPSAVTAGIVDNGDGTAVVSGAGGTPSYSYQWDAAAGNQTTATATGLIHNGTYTVTVTDANGCTATANVTVIINGLDNIPNLSQFDVLPNPNTGEFTIRVSFTVPKDATIRLTNVLGQVLREYNYSDASFNIPIDIANQASGVYFVVLNTSDQSVTRKVIVAK